MVYNESSGRESKYNFLLHPLPPLSDLARKSGILSIFLKVFESSQSVHRNFFDGFTFMIVAKMNWDERRTILVKILLQNFCIISS